MEIQDLKVGQVVCLIDAKLNEGSPADVPTTVANPRSPFGREAVIVAIQDPATHPGKWVALCLREKLDTAHECDGLVPMGHGWWSRPEHLYTPKDRVQHLQATEAWRAQKAAARAIYERFIAPSGELKL